MNFELFMQSTTDQIGASCREFVRNNSDKEIVEFSMSFLDRIQEAHDAGQTGEMVVNQFAIYGLLMARKCAIQADKDEKELDSRLRGND